MPLNKIRGASVPSSPIEDKKLPGQEKSASLPDLRGKLTTPAGIYPLRITDPIEAPKAGDNTHGSGNNRTQSPYHQADVVPASEMDQVSPSIEAPKAGDNTHGSGNNRTQSPYHQADVVPASEMDQVSRGEDMSSKKREKKGKKQMSEEEKSAWLQKKQEKAAQLGGAAKSKKGAPPKRQVAAQPPKETKMEESDLGGLRRLTAANPDLMQILGRAAELGYEVGNVDGQICLIIGGMTYAVEGQIDLLHQLFFDDSKHVIFGWCVGNKRHNKPEALTRVLAAHKPLLGGRISVHDAAYQADWNPDMIQRHFGESADSGKVAKCAKTRSADAASYMAQSQGEGVGFDTMIEETMPGKEAYVGRFAKDITGIIEDFKADPEVRELLIQRTPLMEDFARHIKHPEHRKRALDEQLEVLHRIGNRMYGEGTDKARRAELASHSMSVLEGIAAECIKQDPATMQHLFSLTPGATDFEPAFYRKLYGAIGDSKSTEYMGAQEYEFEQFSAKHELIYIYSAEVGPFLTGASKQRVGEIVAKPLNVTGKPIGDLLTDW